MKQHNRNALEIRFPELKFLTSGIRTEHLANIHVEPLSQNNLYREILRDRTVADPKRPGQFGIVTDTVYAVRCPEESEPLVERLTNFEVPLLTCVVRTNNLFVTDLDRIIVCRSTSWYEKGEGGCDPRLAKGTTVRFDVFIPPKMGMGNLWRETNISKNVPISPELSSQIKRGNRKDFGTEEVHELRAAKTILEELAKIFQFGAYLHGLRDVWLYRMPNPDTGTMEGYDVQVRDEGGLRTITIRKDGRSASFIGSDLQDDPAIEFNQTDLTLEEAAIFVIDFVRVWKEYWPHWLKRLYTTAI